MMRYDSVALRDRLVSISLDLEEDHAGLSGHLQYEAAAHLPEVSGWFEKQKIPLSIFVTGNYLERNGKSLEGLNFPEFHSHGYWHPPHAQLGRDEIRRRNIQDGLNAFESFFKRRAIGYRAACGVLIEEDLSILAGAGIQFDSSFFTGFHVSGFHVFRSARPRWYMDLKLVEIPISAHPVFRLPLSMSYMNLMGSALFSFPQTLGIGMSPLIFNFHMHDLIKTSAVKGLSPFWKFIYRGGPARQKMIDWISKLQDQGVQFLSMGHLSDRLSAKAKGS